MCRNGEANRDEEVRYGEKKKRIRAAVQRRMPVEKKRACDRI
jgi:hypothetical protein